MKNETTRLLEDRIAVRPDAPETETGNGIILPNPQGKGRGMVVTCGPGKRVAPRNELQYMIVKVGDTVLYGRFTGGEITINGESLLLMRECDIVAVIDIKPSYPTLDDEIKKSDCGSLRSFGETVSGKTTYDACCGADCDCSRNTFVEEAQLLNEANSDEDDQDSDGGGEDSKDGGMS